jgi:hypothetical protein
MTWLALNHSAYYPGAVPLAPVVVVEAPRPVEPPHDPFAHGDDPNLPNPLALFPQPVGKGTLFPSPPDQSSQSRTAAAGKQGSQQSAAENVPDERRRRPLGPAPLRVMRNAQRDGGGGPASEEVPVSARGGSKWAKPSTSQQESVESKLRREYDAELSLLRSRREDNKAELSHQMQYAVRHRDFSMLCLLQDLWQQVDPDFDAQEDALRQSISAAWAVHTKPAGPAVRRLAGHREIHEVVAELEARQEETRLHYQDRLRAASLSGTPCAFDLMKECLHHIDATFRHQKDDLVAALQRG